MTLKPIWSTLIGKSPLAHNQPKNTMIWLEHRSVQVNVHSLRFKVGLKLKWLCSLLTHKNDEAFAHVPTSFERWRDTSWIECHWKHKYRVWWMNFLWGSFTRQWQVHDVWIGSNIIENISTKHDEWIFFEVLLPDKWQVHIAWIGLNIIENINTTHDEWIFFEVLLQGKWQVHITWIGLNVIENIKYQAWWMSFPPLRFFYQAMTTAYHLDDTYRGLV